MGTSRFCAYVAFLFIPWSVAAFSHADDTTSQDRASMRFGKIGDLSRDEFLFPVAENLNLVLAPNETGWVVRELDYPLPEDADLSVFENDPFPSLQARFPISGVKEIIVPERINGRKVTEIGDRAFWNGGSIEKIALPDSIIDVGAYAFADCNSLREISLSKRLKNQ